MDRAEAEPAVALGRWAAREPTDGWADWTGTSARGCWLMVLFFRVFGSAGASEPLNTTEDVEAGGEARSDPLRGAGRAGCIP
ncbi:hypothetical protein GCM10010327_44720 [Streptomyces nitrosporeus]|nr:hypothetical protein GCM10010327_44720 [Streptomyces nitrosporeus]